MSLNLRRNYPKIVLLLAILACLTLGMGDQPLRAYTIDSQGVERLAARAANDVAGFAGTSVAAATDARSWLLQTTAAFKISPAPGLGQ